MGWTAYMLEETKPLFERIYEHPFLKELASGTLGRDRMVFSFEQDLHYIDAALRCRSVAAAKAHNLEVRDFFLRNMQLIVDEYHHLEDMLNGLGGQVSAPMAPTCHAYTRHILNIAWTRDPVEYLGAFLPCPLSYDEIGRNVVAVELTTEAADWWRFYMSDEHHDLCDSYRTFVDKYAAELSDERRQQMLDNFTMGINYEYRFWDMAYTQEQWPIAN